MSASSEPGNNDALTGFVFLSVILAIGFFGYRYFFQSDREVLRECFEDIRTSNPEYFDIEMRMRIQELDAAENVEIISRDRTNVVTVVRYAVDRKTGEVWCPN